jgi:hypothetical protein
MRDGIPGVLFTFKKFNKIQEKYSRHPQKNSGKIQDTHKLA